MEKCSGKAAGNRKKLFSILAGLFVMAFLIGMPQSKVQAAGVNGLAKASDGNWYYYVENQVNTTYNGLAKNNGSWWYIKNGKLDFGYTGLCKYNGIFWYVKNGQVDFKAKTLCKYNGNWWYVSGGQVNFKATGLCKYNGHWWYVSGGQVNFKATGLCKYNGVFWYIKDGKIDFNARTLCKYNGSWWYVSGGQVNFKYTGYTKYNGLYWYIKNGKMVRQAGFIGMKKDSSGTWRYYEDGKVLKNYTGMAQNSAGWWYFQNGKVNFSYTGMAKNSAGWWYFQNGKLNFSFTGIVKNSGAYWYFQNGKLNSQANGRISYNGAKFDVENGKAYVVGTNKTGYYNTNANPYEVAYRTGNTSKLSSNDKKIVAGLTEFIRYAEQYKTLYEKEKAIHDYMVANCCYDEEVYYAYYAGDPFIKGFIPYSIDGIFIYKTAVCDGYSQAFQLCMEILGIPCVRISGIANGGGHAWNAVQLEGEWYQVDVTWDDPIPDSPGCIRYNYFNITDAKMREDHSYSWQHTATGTKYRYGRKESEQVKKQENYFTNQADFVAYINKKLEAGETQIQCYFDKSMGDDVNFNGVNFGVIYTDEANSDELKQVSGVSYNMEKNEFYSIYYFEFEIEPYQRAA